MMSANLPTRTLGDGMENNPNKFLEIININQLQKPSLAILKSMEPVRPTSKIINLVPKYVPQEKKVTNIILSKPKEPKFVPYEPYKAAVQPIKSKKVKRQPISVDFKTSKNNVAIQELVKQMSDIRTTELNKLKMTAMGEEEVIPKRQWQKEREAYEVDIKNLKETKAHLENQLKFQAQVNSELKTLLVAAVGEDLEARVQHLTEDKLSLARALLNSANHLTSHQEQTEWLSGQCEVWRSKFLASSLMVEELARWKSALTKRTSDLQELLKRILTDHAKLQKQMLTTFSNLNMVYEKTSNKQFNLKSGDIMELGTANLELSEEVTKILAVNNNEKNLQERTENAYSATEKLALRILKNPVSLSSSQDVLCSALVGVAHSLTGDQMFTQNPLLHPCCSHCKGELQDI
ncbi:unnamed protein product [Ceutorhynchus assimilis]|uniref:Golgin-45 n=1 Tax=Ceutorhynchus assimilis TaxID=467358 RepID=A0A9N9QRQ5_9CUCU|nr:unnamed protein product [Ceutorhynchus assimilis]